MTKALAAAALLLTASGCATSNCAKWETRPLASPIYHYSPTPRKTFGGFMRARGVWVQDTERVCLQLKQQGAK